LKIEGITIALFITLCGDETMLQYIRYSLDAIKDEACELVRQRLVDRKQPIYVLCQFFPVSEWEAIECELERHDFLLRDQVLDLIGREDWRED
jgi:hypothetical protein